jgi:hypothetical protein
MPDTVIDSVFRAHTTSRRCACRDGNPPLFVEHNWTVETLQQAREWIAAEAYVSKERDWLIARLDSALLDQAQPHPCPVILYDVSKAHRILREIKWDALNGCYYFHLAGMYVGVELDGYMHT